MRVLLLMLVAMHYTCVAQITQPLACDVVSVKPDKVNRVSGTMSMRAFQTGDPRRVTYQQAHEKCWQVRKGEKATTIFFSKPYEVEDNGAGDGRKTVTDADRQHPLSISSGISRNLAYLTKPIPGQLFPASRKSTYVGPRATGEPSVCESASRVTVGNPQPPQIIDIGPLRGRPLVHS